MNNNITFLIIIVISVTFGIIFYDNINIRQTVSTDNNDKPTLNINLEHYLYKLVEEILIKLAYVAELDVIEKKSAEISSMVLENNDADTYLSDEFIGIRKEFYIKQIEGLYVEFDFIYKTQRQNMTFKMKNYFDSFDNKIVSYLMDNH